MKKVIILLCLFCCFLNNGFAQDKEVVSQVFVSKAEEFYRTGSYYDALFNLKNAEDAVGAVNANILYLRSIIFDSLLSIQWSYADSTNACLKKFFEIADKTTFPSDKYLLLTNMLIDLKMKQQKYMTEYDYAKHSNDLSTVENYIRSYPNSANSLYLQSTYNMLSDVAALQAKSVEYYKTGDYQAALNQLYMAENLLGATNSVILYYKISLYSAMQSVSWKYVDSAQIALKSFFEVANATNFNAEDYKAMKDYSVDLNARVKKYDDDYNMLISNADYDNFEGYMQAYVGSKHAADLKGRLETHNEQLRQDAIRQEQERVAREKREEQERIERDRQQKIQNKKNLEKLYQGAIFSYNYYVGKTSINYSTLYSVNPDVFSTAIIGNAHAGIDFHFGYMFNKYFGLISGISANTFNWSMDSKYYNIWASSANLLQQSASVLYLSVPLIAYFNSSSSKHRAGIYLQAGVLFNSLLTSISFLDNNYQTGLMSTYFSGGLSVRSKQRKKTFLLGLYYTSTGNLFIENTNESGTASAYGVKLSYMTYMRRNFKPKYREYSSNL